MKYSFANLGENILTRKFGGTTVGVADPFLTGYGFCFFDKIPAGLPSYVSGGTSGISSSSEIQNILSAACMSVTPPGNTMTKVEFSGLGGIKWAVPGNGDYGNTLSIKFLEFSKTPILDIFHNWFKLMRDYRTGASDLISGNTGEGFSKSKYSSVVYYWTTAPDAQTVETYACYDGVFPLKDPQDLYSFDIENMSKLEVEIEFNVDYAWRESWVKDKCQAFADTFASVKDVVKNYGTRL